MNDLKLYRISSPKLFDKKLGVQLDVTIKSNDRQLAIKGACCRAGYTSISDAAASVGMDYWAFIGSVQVVEIEDCSNVVPAPSTEKAVDQALVQLSSATERLPDYVACAVRHWLALERLKRRHGELGDSIDTSWVPGLIKSFEDYHLLVID